MTTTEPMQLQRLRIDPTTWADLHTHAPDGNRSALIRSLVDWYLRRPGAVLPERPALTTCPPSCGDGHAYEGECLASPMIIGTISPRPDQDGYAWRCDGDGECEGLLHLGYPSAAAARRAYDRHLRAEHGGLSAP